MKNSWRHYLRRFATVSAVGGSMAWSSAMCYAVQVAFDTASDPVYSNGWQEGDDGGTGFGPWSFDGTSFDMIYNVAPSHEIDNGLKTGVSGSSPFNDIGKAWTIYNYNGRSRPPNNPPTGGTDITRAGRALSSPLQAGQTISVVIDNPIERSFFRGYTVKLNSGGGNTCYGGSPCTPGTSPTNLWNIGTFEYFTYGLWGGSTLYDEDTDAGVRIDFTLVDSNSYSFTMTPLDNPGLAYTETGDLDQALPIDWIEINLWNTDSDFYPSMVAGAQATDFYIRSIEVTAPDPPGAPGDFNDDGKVDAADYVVWRKNETVNNPLPNDDGLTTQAARFNLWRGNFGEMGGGVGSGAGAIPEPGTCVLLVVGGAVMGLVGSRRRR